jgi:hypothetical protein
MVNSRYRNVSTTDLAVAMLSHLSPFCEADLEETGTSQSTMNLPEAQASQ